MSEQPPCWCAAGRAALAVGLLLAALAVTVARAANVGDHEPFLLSIPDLSSPRATIDTLITHGRIVERIFREQGPGWQPRPAAMHMIETLNTGDRLPPHRQLSAGLAAARLRVVLDRLPPERLAQAPDAEAVRANNITQWRVPGTPIVIAKVPSGPRAGQFQFTPETVGLATDLYNASNAWSGHDVGVDERLETWADTAGPLLPAWIIEALPRPFRLSIFGQAVWQWIGLAILLLGALTIVGKVTVWGAEHDREETRPWHRYGHLVAAFTLSATVPITLLLIIYAIKIWGSALENIVRILVPIGYVGMGWFVIALIPRIGRVFADSRGLPGVSIDTQLINVVCTLLSIAAALITAFLIADLLDVPVGPLLTGLGIGGLAIALAIRSTLENVIGGLTLFADRPIRVGEFGRFGNESGKVEEIGLRTTKVRRLDDTLVTIPNADLALIRIENVTRRRRFLFNPRLGLRYETTVEQLAKIEKGILALFAEHPKVLDDAPRIHVAGFGDFSINLDAFAYIDVTRMAEFVAVQEELNLRILELVRNAGTGFAFPSQTNYIARDTPVTRT